MLVAWAVGHFEWEEVAWAEGVGRAERRQRDLEGVLAVGQKQRRRGNEES